MKLEIKEFGYFKKYDLLLENNKTYEVFILSCGEIVAPDGLLDNTRTRFLESLPKDAKKGDHYHAKICLDIEGTEYYEIDRMVKRIYFEAIVVDDKETEPYNTHNKPYLDEKGDMVQLTAEELCHRIAIGEVAGHEEGTQ